MWLLRCSGLEERVRRRGYWPTVVCVAMMLFVACLSGCGGKSADTATDEVTSGTATTIANRTETADALYAASLVQVMEKQVGPAFTAATGYGFQGEGKGSVAAANLMLEGQRVADVFITPDAEVNRRLMGPANKDLVRWFVSFAGSELVMAYNPSGRFALHLEHARLGEEAWYEVLKTPGLRIGRADPELAPLGYRVLFAFSLAEDYYGVPGLRAGILGSDLNTDQIFPAEELVARLQAGEFDVAFVYETSAITAGVPYVTFPPEVNQGAAEEADLYAGQSYTSAKKGVTYDGSPIVYTVTVPANAKHPAAGTAFALFLLGEQGQTLLHDAGLSDVDVQFGGDAAALPPEVGALVLGALPGW
jgi:molybdate/tungstate transport system substrate-binding protein